MTMRKIATLVIHHSASRSGTVEEFRAEHKRRLGATDIGYHNLIGNGHGLPDGHIAAGRPHEQVGAGVFGNNRGKLHVCCVGNFEKSDPGFTGAPSRAQIYALGHWLHVNGRRYAIVDHRKVVGHREVAIAGHATACPGSEMPMREIRYWYAANIRKMDPEGLDTYLIRSGIRLS
jgi:hypothetical protein